MTTRIEANAAMKQEMKSFEMCVKMLVAMADLKDVKAYLKERNVTKDYLKSKKCREDLFKVVNTMEFTAKNGSKYQAIYRKDKDGNLVEAKWSIWRVLCAIDKSFVASQEAKSIKDAVAKAKAAAKAEKDAAKAEKESEKLRAEGRAAKAEKDSAKAEKDSVKAAANVKRSRGSRSKKAA